jgi:hypothetical protein
MGRGARLNFEKGNAMILPENILKRMAPADRKKLGKAILKRSKLALKFETIWSRLEGPALEREGRVCAERKWRFDYVCERIKVAIEIEGGVWTRGAHLRPIHFISDCEKYNEAALLEITVIRLPEPLVNAEYIGKIIGRIKSLSC